MTTSLATSARPHWRHYAMDTCFYNSLGAYDFDVRCEMLSELGYDATYLTCWSEAAWADVKRLGQVKQRHGLEVAACYVTLDLAHDLSVPQHRRVVELIETIEGCLNIELSIRWTGRASSDAAGDGEAAKLLASLLARAEKRQIQLLLYPHISHWVERLEDGVRLCRQLQHPHLGMVFCGFHWYAVDGKELPNRLEQAKPYLRLANLCGSRRSGDKVPTIEPLDSGELDNFVVVSLMQNMGYDGILGVQGYSVGGDPYAMLRRSLDALKDIERRAAAHPHWANLRIEK
jgi:sugar phosphate isomerase/epimerase